MSGRAARAAVLAMAPRRCLQRLLRRLLLPPQPCTAHRSAELPALQLSWQQLASAQPHNAPVQRLLSSPAERSWPRLAACGGAAQHPPGASFRAHSSTSAPLLSGAAAAASTAPQDATAGEGSGAAVTAQRTVAPLPSRPRHGVLGGDGGGAAGEATTVTGAQLSKWIAALRTLPDAEALLYAHGRRMRARHVAQLLVALPSLDARVDNAQKRAHAIVRSVACVRKMSSTSGVHTRPLIQRTSHTGPSSQAPLCHPVQHRSASLPFRTAALNVSIIRVAARPQDRHAVAGRRAARPRQPPGSAARPRAGGLRVGVRPAAVQPARRRARLPSGPAGAHNHVTVAARPAGAGRRRGGGGDVASALLMPAG